MPSLFDISKLVLINTNTLIYVLAVYGIWIFSVFYYSRPGKKPEIMRHTVVEQQLEMIRSASEKGQPIIIFVDAIGRGGAVLLSACEEIIKRVCRESAKVGTRVLGIDVSPQNILLTKDYARQGYIQAGKQELYSDNDWYYTGGRQSPIVELAAMYDRYKPGAVYILGGSGGTTKPMVVEGARKSGALTFGFTDDGWNTCYNVALCDYFTVSDEWYQTTANIVAEDNPDKAKTMTSVIIGEDWVKLFTIGIIIVANILLLFGVKIK